MDTEQYAGIILGLLTEQLDKRFQYRIPDHLKSKVHVGSVVYVPFGAGNKKTKGFVIDISSDLSFDRDKIKEAAVHMLPEEQPCFCHPDQKENIPLFQYLYLFLHK